MRFIDLFCGAGGLTQGLRMAGWEHAGGVETDGHACATYAANHGAVVRADVRAADPCAFAGDVDLVAASPPCQSVSGANRASAEAHADDALFEQVVRFAVAKRARAVLIENVPRFAVKRGPDGATLADRAVALLERAGYRASWRILDACDFGVPQRRRRLFVVGVMRLEGKADGVLELAAGVTRNASRNASAEFRWPEGKAQGAPFGSIRVSDAEARRQPYDVFMSRAKTAYYVRRRAEKPQYVRYADDAAVANTLRAGYLKSRGAECLVPRVDARGALKSLRMLTIRECARIQGFPEDYAFCGPAGAVYKQVGNAVPPPLARAVGDAILRSLSEVPPAVGAPPQTP